MHPSWTRAAVSGLLLMLAAGAAEAQGYRYGRGYTFGADQAGVMISVEGGLVNQRNSGLVYATSESLELFGGGFNRTVNLIPGAEDDFAGRVTSGYQWGNGNRVTATFWVYETSTSAATDGPLGGALHYTIGPPIALGAGNFVGDSGSPGYFSLATDTEAATADLAFGRSHELGDEFRMEWSTGIRYARFVETTTGFYDDGLFAASTFGNHRYAVRKEIDGKMIGARIAARGSYFLTTTLSISAGIGFAFLDGEIEASSGLTPSGLLNATTQPSSLATIEDDGRSGHTSDFDMRLTWHAVDDHLRLWLGWEQQRWSGIVEDGLRGFRGTTASTTARDSVAFSGYQLGVSYRF